MPWYNLCTTLQSNPYAILCLIIYTWAIRNSVNCLQNTSGAPYYNTVYYKTLQLISYKVIRLCRKFCIVMWLNTFCHKLAQLHSIFANNPSLKKLINHTIFQQIQN